MEIAKIPVSLKLASVYLLSDVVNSPNARVAESGQMCRT